MHALFVRIIGCALVIQGAALEAQPFNQQAMPADLARWMYPFNASPSSRPSASTFAAFGNIPDFDTRDGQCLLGWNTTNSIAPGMGVRNYLLRRVRVTLTISRDMAYRYSSTLRDYRSYFPTNDPRYLPSPNADCPVELFGAGFRGGWTAETFQQGTAFYANPSGSDYTNRTAYAAGFDTNGILVDVSDNVGDDGTNEIANPFEVAPFAVGSSTNVQAGELMPEGSQLVFDVNLDDPLIYGYFQQALNNGRLMLMASSLLNANFFSGSPNYPDFYTIFSPLADPDQYPLLDIEGTIVRSNLDADADGLPDDWEQFYFGALGAGATNDPDGDGVNNLGEYYAGTNPTNSSSVFRTISIAPNVEGTELRFTFAPNRQYTIQRSADLRIWETVPNPALFFTSAWLSKTTNNPSYPSAVFGLWTDTNAPSTQRFYRIAGQ